MNMKKYYFIIVLLITLILPNVSSAQTAEELQARINALITQIQSLQSQLTQVQSPQPTVWCYNFKANLKVGDTGHEVRNLVIALKKEGFEIDDSEQGDSGNETFNESTASAISGFQQKYIDEILKPVGLKYGTGFAGRSTRAKLNQLYGCGTKPSKPPVVCAQYIPPLEDFCVSGEIVYPDKDENGCFRPPKCILSQTDNQPPVTHGVGGPTTLKTGETGTWKIWAYDPENGPLTYNVNWGDTFGSGYAPQTANLPSQTATFTHSYNTAGTYTPIFTVTDKEGLSAKTSISVNVDVTPTAVSEQVKCVFNESKIEQKCYSSNNYACSGTETCVIDMKGAKGEQVTWKSSCGGYAYTAMDGQNEYAEFKCAVSTVPTATPVTSACIQVITPAKNSLTGECVNFATPCEVKAGWEKISSCSTNTQSPTTLKPTISPIVVGTSTRKFRPVDPSRCPGIAETSCAIEPANIIKVSVYDERGGYVDTRENTNSGMAGFVNLPYGNYTVVINAEGFEYHKAPFTVCATCEEITTIFLKKTLTSPSITVLSPNGGEIWQKGSTQIIKWNSSGASKIYIKLRKGSDTYPGGEGAVSNIIPNEGFYKWTIPSTLPDGKDYAIRVINADNLNALDDSNAVFSIVAGTVANLPDIQITDISPASVAVNRFATYTAVVKNNSSQDVTAPFAVNLGGTATTISSLAAWQTATVNASFGLSILGPNQVCVRVDIWNAVAESDELNNDVCKTVNVAAETGQQSSITILSPNGGEIWQAGSTYNVKWTNTTGKSVKIELIKGEIIVAGWDPIDSTVSTYNVGLPLPLQAGSDYKIRITSSDSSNADTSDKPFSIAAGTSGLKDIEKLLASISQAVLQLSEKIKELRR